MNFRFSKSHFSSFSSSYFKKSFFKSSNYFNVFNCHLNTQKVMTKIANLLHNQKVLFKNSYKKLGNNNGVSPKILSGTTGLTFDLYEISEGLSMLLDNQSNNMNNLEVNLDNVDVNLGIIILILKDMQQSVLKKMITGNAISTIEMGGM